MTCAGEAALGTSTGTPGQPSRFPVLLKSAFRSLSLTDQVLVSVEAARATFAVSAKAADAEIALASSDHRAYGALGAQ
jgi:hypothetical protein